MPAPSKFSEPPGSRFGIAKPLPVLAIAAVCICNCAHFYAVCSLFSYAGIMCADMGWAEDRDHAGEIAGFLQSSNVLGRIPTSFIWGWLAGIFGLRAGLAASMVSLIAGGAAFGFCTSVAAAVAVRFAFFGMGNGWVTLFGPISMELGGTERQTEVTGIVFAVGTLAQLLGPALGGWTYGVVEGFPAVVPSVIGAFVGMAALVALWVWMPSLRVEVQAEDCKVLESAGQRAPGFLEVFCEWPTPLLVLLRSAHGFLNFSFFEVVPLWAISSVPLGGLALTESILGSVFAFSAVGSAAFMAVGIKRVTASLGLRRSAVLGNVACAVCFAFMPFLPNAVALMCVHALTNSGMGMLGAVYIATMNNHVHPAQRAAVNGVCVTFEAFGKGIGPLSTAIAFSWTLSEWGISGHAVIFFAMALLHLLLIWGTTLLPDTVEASSSRCVRVKLKGSPLPSSSPAPAFFGARESVDCSTAAGGDLLKPTPEEVRIERHMYKSHVVSKVAKVLHLGKSVDKGHEGNEEALRETVMLVETSTIGAGPGELLPSEAVPLAA